MALLKIPHPSLEDLPSTSLTANAAAAATSLTVENGLSFSANEWVVFNGYGNAKSEIQRISAAAPTATGIVLNGATPLDFAQNAGTTIQKILFNQVDIEYSENLAGLFDGQTYATPADAASAATWTNLTTTNITADNEFTVYNDTSLTARSYRTRFYDSNAGVYSAYSDPILPTGYEEFSIGNLIDKSIGLTGKRISQEDSGQITEKFLLQQANMCIRYVHSLRKRWSWKQEFDAVVAELNGGQIDYFVPTNMDVSVSKRSTYHVRVNDNKNLTYLDKTELDQRMAKVHHSELAAVLNTSSTTATFDDTSDFGDSGTFKVITGSTEDTVSYTANNRSTNVLTLASSTGVSTTHAVDTDVWEQGSFGTPQYFTIYEKKIYIYPIPTTSFYQNTLKADYYTENIELNSLNDYILFPDPNIIVWYLCWAISVQTHDDTDTNLYKRELDQAIERLVQKEYTGEKRKWSLQLNTAGYPISGRATRSFVENTSI